MNDKFLYEELDAVSKIGFLKKEIPDYLKDNKIFFPFCLRSIKAKSEHRQWKGFRRYPADFTFSR